MMKDENKNDSQADLNNENTEIPDVVQSSNEIIPNITQHSVIQNINQESTNSQPNQQSFNQSSNNLGDAPLQLPIKKSKNKNKFKLILAIISLLVIVLGGAFGFFFYQKKLNDPNRIFTQAIEKRLNVKYIQQDYATTDKSLRIRSGADGSRFNSIAGSTYESSITTYLKSQSDFSNPSLPKSTGQLTLNAKKLFLMTISKIRHLRIHLFV